LTIFSSLFAGQLVSGHHCRCTMDV